MTAVNKRKKRWYVEGTWPDGRRFRYSQRTKGLADALWGRILAAKADGSWRELRRELDPRRRDRGGPATVRELVGLYLHEHVAARALKGRFHRETAPIIVLHLGAVRLAEFGREHVNRFISARRAEGVSSATINRGLAFLRGMFSYALPLGHVRAHPLAGVKPLREETRPRRALEAREVAALIAAADAVNPTLGAMVALAAETGLRVSELLRLQWRDVRGGVLTVRAGKSGRHRTVPLTPRARARIDSLERLVGFPWLWIRPTRGKGRPARWVSPRESFAAARKAAGLEWAGWHDLRHYRLTRWALAGMDIVTVRELAGHRSIATTAGYTHADEARAAAEVARIAEMEAGEADREESCQ